MRKCLYKSLINWQVVLFLLKTRVPFFPYQSSGGPILMPWESWFLNVCLLWVSSLEDLLKEIMFKFRPRWPGR